MSSEPLLLGADQGADGTRRSGAEASKHRKSNFSNADPSSFSSSAITTDARIPITRSKSRISIATTTNTAGQRFTIISVLGVGFSLTNSWFGVSAALVAGINSGGPALLVYGIPLIAVVSCAVGISLAELASAMPNAGGQYYWASVLAEGDCRGGGGGVGGIGGLKGTDDGERWDRRLPGYVTGWCAWMGSLFTSASVALAMGSALCGCWQLVHPEFEIKPWMVFTAYQAVNIFCFLFNLSGKLLPKVAQITLYISLISFITILIIVSWSASPHQPAKFVFATFINNTGWPSPIIAYIVGLVNANWAFACLDCATHLAEEVQHPERVVPIAIMGTVAIGFVTAWLYVVAMFFSLVGDVETLVRTPTLVPILELYHQAVGSRGGAVALESLIIATGCGCLIASHTWQSRLCWSFARDRGLPGHGWLSAVDETLDLPLNAHLLSCGLVSGFGGLYLLSYTAFNSMATACIVLLYISYSIPVSCLLLLRGRDNIQPGPFWLGKYGYTANLVLVAWTLFTLIMYSLPYRLPVTPNNMNYVSVVYVLVGSVVAVDWAVRGKGEFRGLGERSAEEVALIQS